jgi:hypothetical protein
VNEDVDLAIRSEGGSEQVVAEISFVSSPKIIAGANYHHTARRAPNLPLPGAPTVRGLDLSSPQGLTPVVYLFGGEIES